MKIVRIAGHIILYTVVRRLVFTILIMFRPIIALISQAFGRILSVGSILALIISLLDDDIGNMLGNRFNTMAMFGLVFVFSILLSIVIEIYDQLILKCMPDGWFMYFKYY
jgi:hypothetical protein